MSYGIRSDMNLISCFEFQLKQFAKLYEHIKNDKYLVGRRLVNYHHKSAIRSS